MQSVPLLLATLPFQLRRIVHLGRPHAPVREGSMNFLLTNNHRSSWGGVTAGAGYGFRCFAGRGPTQKCIF